ncbi:hypothetical protein BDN70DRAFT_879558 [Pholiota conissans]|uniref:F-box domain-containing protein n=1 Tax=Pholiota conissans TaxID=109636 RepID=A0A9P5YZP4_9AGAR|nr:hypothetical protein BDN70DRAFT_879558 [Pholiota conissans]
MYGRISLQDNISIGEAFRHINEAIEQHRATIEQHKTTIEQHRATILALQSQIADLESQSRLHQASVLALKSQSNDYTPISQLPPEVLCRIFSFAQRNDDGQMLPYPEWTRLTHVIRRWRDVAINSSILWTEPHFGNIRWCEEAFRRSKDAGLVINVWGSAQEHRQAFQFALRHTAHIRGLFIYDTKHIRRSVWNRLCYELVETEPRLEFLRLSFVSSRVYPQTFGVIREPYPFYVPEDAFKIKLQRLRSLRLTCYTNWDSRRIFHHALVHLTIHNTGQPKPTGEQFVLAMKEMPCLEYLNLDNALPIAAHQSDSSWAINDIHLSHLRALYIVSEIPQEVEVFFQLVTFPPDAAVKVDCFPEEISTTECINVISAISRSYSNEFCCSRFQTLDLEQPCYINALYGGFQLRLYSTPFPDDKIIEYFSANTDVDVPNFNLDLYFEWTTQKPPNPELDIDLIIQNIFGQFPLLDIRQAYLELASPLHEDDDMVFPNPDTLLNTFGRLPELRTLVTGTYACKTFINALELGLNIQDTTPPGLFEHLYFPKLSSICLHNPRIANGKSAPNPIAVEIDSLQNCLIRRYKNSAEIQYCRFEGPYGLGPWISAEMLEKMVSDSVQIAKGCTQPQLNSKEDIARDQLEEQGNKENKVF